MDPAKLKKWLIFLAVAYLIFPRDLIPDFLGRGLGLLDDLLLGGLLIHFYRRSVRGYAAREDARRAPVAAPESSLDPYEILGVPSSASGEEIRAAYKARMTEYHPDKVAHLGEELQEVAHRKAQEIQQAYQQLRK